jgi:chemotaxis protein MotB
MSEDPFSKLQASRAFEDLLDQPSTRHTQNWLLTYLDVFVLIVMLVITLITIGNFNTKLAPVNKPQPQKTQKAAPATTCPPVVACQTTQQAAPAENKVEIKDAIADKTEPKKSDNILPAPINAPEIKIAAETAPVPPPIPKPLDTQPTVQQPQLEQPAVKPADENKLQQKLAKIIDEFGLNDAVNIEVKQGYAQLEIQDKVLFSSSQADLTPSGKALIERLTPLLKQAVGLILIEGHTDNIPIKSAQFPSNWELGSARATSVLHFLASQQIDSSRLRAITYADTVPIADNSTPEGREKNRRVSILIKVPEEQI